MIFESKYRRQAMERWSEEKVLTAAEFKQAWKRLMARVHHVNRRLTDAIALFISTRGKQI